jgi:ADP-ribose pyrophosphatase YjhB (NUDIX family)
MADESKLKWLEWAREIQSISQTGLAFAANEYEVERNKRLAELASEIIAEHSDANQDAVLSTFLAQVGYATPKVDVRAAVVVDNKILLVKEVTDGCWAMPGGWADVGDTPSEVATRETFEESGYKVKPTKVVGVFDANRSGRPLELFHAYKIVFLCDLLGGSATTSNETLDVGFFPFEELPELSINRTNERHLNEIIAHLKDANRAVFFD